ncbi:TMAO reductase system periplasmic protein TorT [Ruegeria sp. 2012CJ41-6]|uniref:TMAO reductase system periplasmic protein TorT n=1 Tax=Ruegeria spongiae TaxID=2942209 RepID=A0ABT0Q3H3_9RHOB|nr:TMAO reductase system periplasmic protein TorT [Ruegeria spongiae]MCL6284157.1 TMAO reductase system periplasmic protein TorT [Ruegeria spongiae]
MKHSIKILAGCVATACAAGSVSAQDAPWWPFTAEDWTSGEAVPIEYEPTETPTKKWKLCAVYPHIKDSWWIAVNYGQVSEAQRQGAELTIFEAGGYTNLNQQISQFDDCVALGADAILVSVISEAGLANQIEEATNNGTVIVGVGNPIFEAKVTSKIFTDQELMGFTGGQLVREMFGEDPARVVQFPGPQGAGWAESSAAGFRRAVEGSEIEILEDKYGDTGKSVQLRLVEDALQAHDDVDLLYGVAVMAEVAVTAVDEAGLADDTQIVSWYSNQGMIDGVKNGTISGTVTQYPVAIGRIGVDLAIRALEGREHAKEVHPVPLAVTAENVGDIDLTRAFAVPGFQPTFKVD